MTRLWTKNGLPRQKILNFMHTRKRAQQTANTLANQLYIKKHQEVKQHLRTLITNLHTLLDQRNDEGQFKQNKLYLRICQHYLKPIKPI